MTNKLQNFMKKIGKLNKSDYAITLSNADSYYLVEFDILLIDYSQTCKLYVDYINRKSIDNLVEWLGENCDTIESYGKDDGNCRYYFEGVDDFVVDVAYLSNLVD